MGLLFANAAPLLRAHGLQRSITGARVESANKGGMPTQVPRLARNIDEDRLHDILRAVRVADDPQRRRIYQVDVTTHHVGEGGFGPFFDVAFQQFVVVDHLTALHPPHRKCHRQNGDRYVPPH